ncbi:hypothetical protein [Paracoccus sp. IB05]|uniref:hypothetical protein n=1 Tax=Paracoccus sp. IB05 TaxID=2779367 RepID=UPI0018E7184C|nr:hypothetical protein [Paracoccus sp. IB05]MBJ2154044.1 hypothetical protein [Paracoccus sp. IB05]
MSTEHGPGHRDPRGRHADTFRADAARLRRLFLAGVPVIAVGLYHYRIDGPLPPGFRWDEDEDE